MVLTTMLCSIFILSWYYKIENDIGNYNTQIFIAFGFSIILYFIFSLIFKEKKFQPFFLLVFFSTMLLMTEAGKEIRIQQKNHIIYQDIGKFDELYFDGKKVIGVNSEKIGATWFLGIDETTFILLDDTKIECIKDKCNILKRETKWLYQFVTKKVEVEKAH